MTRAIGTIAAVVALGLCIRAVAVDWSNISKALEDASWSWLIAGLAASALAMSGLAVLWWTCLRAFGERITIPQALSWYFGGELGKYIPGGVWAVLGRGEMARRDGQLSVSTVYATTLISYGVMSISAASICALALPFVPRDGDGVGWFAATVALVPLGLLVVHPLVFGPLLSLGKRITRGRLDMSAPPWGRMVRLIVVGMPTWVLFGLASWMVTESLGFGSEFFRIIFAAVAAWLIGFLAIPVPAGAGLREGIFVLLCGLSHGEGAAVALIARALLLVVDGTGGAIGLTVASAWARRS